MKIIIFISYGFYKSGVFSLKIYGQARKNLGGYRPHGTPNPEYVTYVFLMLTPYNNKIYIGDEINDGSIVQFKSIYYRARGTAQDCGASSGTV
jgi:hypothetical protein